MAAGQRIDAALSLSPAGGYGPPPAGILRVFDADGDPLYASPDPGAANVRLHSDTDATFYLGVSGSPHWNYDPVTGTNGGTAAQTSVTYALTLSTVDPPVGDAVADNTAHAPRWFMAAGDSRSLDVIIGDGGTGAADVDLYALDISVGATLISRVPDTGHVRMFNPDGTELFPGRVTSDAGLVRSNFTIPYSGTVYVGFSGRGNTTYSAIDPDGPLGIEATFTADIELTPLDTPDADAGDTLASARRVAFELGRILPRDLIVVLAPIRPPSGASSATTSTGDATSMSTKSLPPPDTNRP